ncbi:hypothetical protein GYH73_002185 [Bacillus megaterium]|nr:hypothetical protein [Priestia megaterium]
MEVIDYLWNSIKALKIKDFITIGGVLATSFISLKTLRHTKKNNSKSLFVNSITKERVESMGELKEQVARYLSTVARYSLIENNKNYSVDELVKEIEYTTLRIVFQLNPNNSDEEKIHNELRKINAIIKYRLLYMNNDNEKTYPTGLLNLIDDHAIEVTDFYSTYHNDRLIYSNIEVAKKILNRFQKNHPKLLEKTLDYLVKDIREHLKGEWNKIKTEAESK